MLTSAMVLAGLLLTQSPDPAPATTGDTGLDLGALLGPIIGTGIGGVLFLMVIFKIKVMPTYVYDKAVADHEKELARRDKEHADEVARLEADKAELKISINDAHSVYTEQVIPTLTRVLDAERELVELRRDEAAERRRREHS